MSCLENIYGRSRLNSVETFLLIDLCQYNLIFTSWKESVVLLNFFTLDQWIEV